MQVTKLNYKTIRQAILSTPYQGNRPTDQPDLTALLGRLADVYSQLSAHRKAKENLCGQPHLCPEIESMSLPAVDASGEIVFEMTTTQTDNPDLHAKPESHFIRVAVHNETVKRSVKRIQGNQGYQNEKPWLSSQAHSTRH